mgnify:CR=1 FL=1
MTRILKKEPKQKRVQEKSLQAKKGFQVKIRFKEKKLTIKKRIPSKNKI